MKVPSFLFLRSVISTKTAITFVCVAKSRNFTSFNAKNSYVYTKWESPVTTPRHFSCSKHS